MWQTVNADQAVPSRDIDHFTGIGLVSMKFACISGNQRRMNRAGATDKVAFQCQSRHFGERTGNLRS